MNKTQILVLCLGVILLVLNFVFPYSSYAVIERSVDGLTIRSSAKTGFMPFWTVHSEHEKALLEGNPFGDTYILWPWVFVFAAIIVVTSVWLIYRLGEPENAVSQEPIDEK